MALLKIHDNGELEAIRNLNATKKEGRLKYGALDAQFNPMDARKLISVTRNGTLTLLNFDFKGRSCRSNQYPFKQRVNKVTWIKTNSALAAASDGKCYLWDTRNSYSQKPTVFNKLPSSKAYSVRVSPFNDNLFAVSHDNGYLNVLC